MTFRLAEDLTDQPFGKLVVLAYLGKSRWKCRCACGKITRTPTTRALKIGAVVSCGCYRQEASGARSRAAAIARNGPVARARAAGLSYETARARVRKGGWDPAYAFSRPPQHASTYVATVRRVVKDLLSRPLDYP